MILPIDLHHLGALPKSGISFKSFIWYVLCFIFVSSVCVKGEFFFLGLTKQQQQHQAPIATTIIICNNNESNNNNVKKNNKQQKQKHNNTQILFTWRLHSAFTFFLDFL